MYWCTDLLKSQLGFVFKQTFDIDIFKLIIKFDDRPFETGGHWGLLQRYINISFIINPFICFLFTGKFPSDLLQSLHIFYVIICAHCWALITKSDCDISFTMIVVFPLRSIHTKQKRTPYFPSVFSIVRYDWYHRYSTHLLSILLSYSLGVNRLHEACCTIIRCEWALIIKIAPEQYAIK